MTYARTTTVDAAPAGDTVRQGVLDVDTDLTGIYANLNTHETATTGIHGAGSGTLVSTTGTQTLTAKTISGATITGAIECSGATLSTPTITGATISNPTITGGTITGATFASPTLTAASDTAYGASWDNVTDTAPSKNAVYDKIETLMAKTGSNLAIGSDADGDMYYRASSVLARLAKGTANYKMFMKNDGSAPEWHGGYKVGTFTRAMAAATGTVSYTGVGFKPTLILFSAGYFGGTGLWFGATDGSDALANSLGTSTDACISLLETAGKYQTAVISSFDDDGFTLSWTRTGATTASTQTIMYVALR